MTKTKKTIASMGIGASLLVGGGAVAIDNNINPYTDKGTHYEMKIESSKEDSYKLEIQKNSPDVTFSFWDDTERITITPQFKGAGKTSKAKRDLFSNKLEFTKGDTVAFIQPRDNQQEFDIDFHLYSKPTSNVFSYKVSGAENFNFFYQEEQGEGVPENVFGSYAVYYKVARNGASSKAFQIYRPQAIDADGNKAWAELQFKDNLLTVTVPQEFLNTAIYPVVVDPTFGKTDDGTNVQTFSGDRIYLSTATPASSGTITKGNGRVRVTSASTSEIKMVIFSDSGGVPDDFLAQSDEVVVNWTTSADTEFPFSGANLISIVSGTPYWVGFWADDPGTPSYEYKRDNNAGVNHFAAEVYAEPGTPTTPFVSGGTSNGPLNAYITYTEASGSRRIIFIE